MKNKLFLLLIIPFLTISCEKEITEPVPVVDDYKFFRSYDRSMFQGKVFDKGYDWKHASQNYGISTAHGAFWCLTHDTTIQERSFSIRDNFKRTNLHSLEITSPAFNVNDSYEDKRMIFEAGMKTFFLENNSIYSGFRVEGVSNGDFFSSIYGSQKSSTFEIYQSEELHQDIIRLWIIVNCNLYNIDGEFVSRIEDGRFINIIELKKD